MAGPCVLYNGKKYTKGEFAALLHDGELSNLIGNSKLDATVLKGEIPAQFKVATPEPKKMSVITPEKSSNFANLTQDEQGNAVFFHVGDTGYETIKPSSGQSTRTSKGEAAAIGKVGGVAMYYTSPNDSETMVTGPGKYAVKVPIEKVYDFNTDENNYLEEAQKRHEAENPGKAMDANSELAYITKIAGENGYDMVVADWGGKTRAQTTKELTPADTQVSNGAQVTKTFDEKYVPNTEKGFVSVVPESKDSKFQKIYDKIYKYRNSQQNYDALYKLSTSSLDREGVTKLVNESDLPQDLKDEYNKVDKQRQGKRRSYMKTEEVSIEGAPEGNYLNVGMEIGKDGEMLTIEEIKEALPDDVEVSEEIVKDVESEFNGEVSKEPTTILKISRPLTDAEMQNLLVATDQMGISQMVDGKGIVHGTEQWGKFNPKFFHMPDSRVLSDVVSKEKTIEQEVEEISDLFSTDINKAVENAKAALSNLLPNVKFVIHDDYDSYTKAVGDEDVESGGTYVSKTNTIHINKRAATKTTVAHEVFHAVLLNMVGTDVKAADVTKRMINALSKQLDSNPDLKEYLENFVASYDENIKNEEKAAELFGYLSANYDTLPKQSQNLIKRWMDAIAKLFGFKPFTDNEVVDFFNTLSEKVATGQEVAKSDISLFNAEGDGGFVGTLKISRKQNGVEAPRAKDDSRNFIRNLVEDLDIRELNGEKFITNMYDYTNAGKTDLGNGFEINLFGGKGYVPYMMELNNKKIGDVSNLAAFNTKAQAETFIRNAEKSGAKLFAPHSGTKDQSWQFQQHTFSELVDVILDKKILTKTELINTFNNSIKDSKALKETFSKFSDRYGKNIKDFNSFKSDPRKIVDLLDIKNNLSPDLRKALNNSIASNKKFQEAIGIKNKEQFYNKIMDPLNNGVTGGEIMGVVKFDPNTFKIVETKPDDIDHHPSFGYTLLAKINGIYQPTEFYKSYDITDSYIKYNINGDNTSIKSEDVDFDKKNVTSSAGAIPKVAKFNIPKRKQTSVISNKIKAAKQAGFSDAAISQYLQNNGYTAEQASKGLLDYNKKEIQKAQKEEGIFLEDTGGKFKNYIGKIRRTIISARGFMAKSQRLGIEERVANIEYQLKMASNTSKKIDRLLRNYKGDKEKVLSDFDLYIRGDNSVTIPNEFKALADIGRNQIDGLTYMLIKFQAIPADSVENIKANIGSYMNRAYEIYNNKNWPKKVKQEVVENAKSYFRTELLKIALNNSKSTGNNINDEVLNSLNEIQNKTNELERLISDYKKSKNNQTKVIDKVKEVSALMTKYGFEEGNQLFDYISKTGNNFDDRKISDKIDSFFKRTSIIKKSATSSKTSGIDLNTQLERDIDNQIDKILNKDITNDFINSGKEGAKDLSVLKRRMDIPLEIRALMGEYTDPVQNYVNTVRKLSEFAYRAKYLTEIKEKGLGTIFFEKEDVNRPQNFKYEIASDSTKTLDPLGGLYTSKELKEVFDNNASLLEQTGNTLNKFSFIRNYMRTLRYVKKAATIQSAGTQSKNALGAFEFALSNGHFDLKEYSDAYKVVRNDLKNGGNKFLEDKMLDYIKSGAITQNVALGEIKSMFKDDDFEKAFERRMNTPDQSKLSKIIKASKSYLNKADKILIDAYQSSDNLFKIIGFEIERKRYSDILYDKKYEALTDDQKKDVDRVVAENIKNIYPNYDRIGEIGKFFKVFPAGASFISFELESLRTSYNTVSLAFSEMKSDNPKSRKLGATRFAALAATRLLRESLRYATGAATFGWLRGLGDDEEEEANKKAKRFTPEYTKNSSISIIDMGKGKFSYIDFSASDPRSKMPKMLEAFISGEDPSSMLINLIEESVSPFVSDDILLNTITNLYNNEDDFGKPIFNKYDTPLNIGNNIITYASKVFLPGTVKSVQKVVKSDSQVAASIGQVTGYRIADVEIEKQYYFKAKKTSEELRKANDIYDDAFRKFEKGEITDKERKEAYDQSNKSVKLVLGEANKDFNSAVFFGANPDALNETLSKVRLSESDQIMTGEFEDIDSKIPLTKEESMKEIERLKEKIKSRGIKNLDEIRSKARNKGGN